jgi:hypothetical protein
MEQAYGAQTTEYQNTSIRLGFLMVLDQVQVLSGGSPHLRDLVHVASLARHGETEPRRVVLVRVPGRRRTPSTLSRAAKRKGASLSRRGSG